MGGERKPPQARDRIIGARLRAIRKEQTNLSLEAAAELVGWSPSTLSRTETGKRHVTTEDVATVLAVYKIPVPQREAEIEAARAGNSSGWWDREFPGVPREVGALASYEADASALTDWSPHLIPGLLQTYGYATALLLADGAEPADVEPMWMVRLRRQQILTSIRYSAIIGEVALRTPFGGAGAMREQLEHLDQAARRGISIRIVPERRPAPALLHGWMYMEFPSASPVIHVELMRSGGVFLHDRDADAFTPVMAKIDRVALSASASRTLVRKTIEEWS